MRREIYFLRRSQAGHYLFRSYFSMLEARTEPIASSAGFKITGLRWWIIGLVFLATLINYLDRLTISVLAPEIIRDLHLDRFQYGSIAAWFLLAYTISQAL